MYVPGWFVNGWTWFVALAVFVCLAWPKHPDLQGEMALCMTTQATTEAQRDGLMLQSIVLSKEVDRLNGEVNKANQWAAGARSVIGQLELKCQTYKP